MKWFLNMKIRNKLMLSFIFLAVITFIVGILGVYNMNAMNQESRRMYDENVIPVQYLIKAQSLLQEARANHLLALYERDTETLQTRLDKITEVVNQTNQLLIQYDAIDKDDIAKDLLIALTNALENYKTIRNTNLDLIRNQQYDTAKAELSRVSDARTQTDTAMQALIDYNTKLSQDILEQNNTRFNSNFILMISLIICAAVIAISLGLFISAVISKPIKRMAAAADRLAMGDMDLHIQAKYHDEAGQLADSFEKMVTNINEVLSGVAASSEQVNSGSQQVSDSSVALSQGATEQASSVQELTASVEQISSQTRLNAQNATQANELAIKAKENADSGNSQMKEMVVAMDNINTASASISKIIKVIDDIAFQTNILALNAAVEAARAGQHGKGFAVVAEEVRNLAARSAKAAKETTDMIETSIKKTEAGSRMAAETAQALNMIVHGIEQVAELVNHIAIASNEQAIGIEQINQGIMQVSQVVQHNSATSQESAAASEELSSQATMLRDMVGKFKLRQNVDYMRLGSYRDNTRLSELSPEVRAMLENMSDRKPKNGYQESEDQDHRRKKSKIVLNENEFGKY